FDLETQPCAVMNHHHNLFDSLTKASPEEVALNPQHFLSELLQEQSEKYYPDSYVRNFVFFSVFLVSFFVVRQQLILQRPRIGTLGVVANLKKFLCKILKP